MQLFSYAYYLQRVCNIVVCQREKRKRKIIHHMYTHILEDIRNLEEGTTFFFSFSLKTI